ncbi:MAG: zf-HC2 domain-containing protein [Acidobacteriota bacterium]|nr:zf-HC2 domain-containing protein [Acidobacteriota bacterium]
MMRCHEIQALLSEWLDGELESSRTQDVAAHLDGCAECRRRLEELAVPGRALREMVPQAAPPGFEARLAARLQREGLRGPERRLRGLGASRWRIAALLLLAGVLLVVLVLSFLTPSSLREAQSRLADQAVAPPTSPSLTGVDKPGTVGLAGRCSSPMAGADCWSQSPCSSALECPSPQPMVSSQEPGVSSFESLQLPADTPGRMAGFEVGLAEPELLGSWRAGELELSGS